MCLKETILGIYLDEEFFRFNPNFYCDSEGVYGDVTRVKILFNKKDSALVQMKEPAQAQLGMMSGRRKNMRMRFSHF